MVLVVLAVLQRFEQVFTDSKNELATLFTVEDTEHSAFLFQPEVLMIYDQLQKNEYNLRQEWNKHFPEEELERLAIKFAKDICRR